MFKQKAERRDAMAEAPLHRAWVERAAAPRRGRCIVAVSSERQILVLDEDGHGRIAGPGPVPGASEVLAAVVDAEGSTVLTADGAVWLVQPRGRGWVQIGSMMAGAAPGVALRCLKGFKLDVDRTLAAGDSFTVDSLERARELMRLGFAAPAPPEPDAA